GRAGRAPSASARATRPRARRGRARTRRAPRRETARARAARGSKRRSRARRPADRARASLPGLRAIADELLPAVGALAPAAQPRGQGRGERGPAGLVARSEPAARLAVEVLVEQHEVLP